MEIKISNNSSYDWIKKPIVATKVVKKAPKGLFEELLKEAFKEQK